MFKFIQFILKPCYDQNVSLQKTKHLFAVHQFRKSFVFLMRCSVLAFVFQVTFASILLAIPAKGQNLNEVNVRLNLNNATVEESLLQLQKSSGFKFTLFKQLIQKERKKVTLNTSRMSVSDALKKILWETGLSYRLVNEFIVIEAKPVPPKPGRISGNIVDEKGETLPGASVRVIETGNSVQADVNGTYILNLQPGTYTLEFSYISYLTQRVTGVVVSEGSNTPLNISLKSDSKGLKEVVVTSSYQKASVEGLLAKQKNASEISNGISAEQIARTPDNNIGQSLKRISGVSSVDNKFVLIRGIGERYNAAMLDGVVLPSTEAQSRNFSFDLIPSNMVDNVVVSKTVTPDMNASFGGGLIQINTKDIPNENFMSFTVGTSYNDQSTGKEFLSHKRGKYDYLGFDDGRRSYPEGLVVADRRSIDQTIPVEVTQKRFDDQSKRFTNDNFTVYKYKAAPSQNYQFSLGRLFALDTVNQNKFGFTGAFTYRNTQTINIVDDMNRGDWLIDAGNTGKAYGFNTTLGGLLNAGLQLGKNRFTLRNTYTHMYDNVLLRITGYDNNNGGEDLHNKLPPNRIREADDPTFTDLLQNKLSGQHRLGKIKIEWNVARAGIKREEKDLILANRMRQLVSNKDLYYYNTGIASQPEISNGLSRHHYTNQEQHYSWDLATIIPFKIASFNNTIKTGYYGNRKSASNEWQIAALSNNPTTKDSLRFLPISEMIKPENMGIDGFNYSVSDFWLNKYEGKSKTHAVYAMLDNRFTDQLRLVWGVRADYYKYTEIANPPSGPANRILKIIKDKEWQWLPSANLTYSPLSSLNFRAAVSSSVVRPELLENSQFLRYSPYLEAQFQNSGLYSTRIDSYDLKTEWFPGLGEVFSVGAFYKKFDKPAELTSSIQSGRLTYFLQNAEYAKVHGMEFELRKNFGLIFDDKVLKNMTIYGNLTLQKSTVVAVFQQTNPDKTPGAAEQIDVIASMKRPMYGQAPYLLNLGMQYAGESLGVNIAYNKSGFKTYVVSENPGIIEYERPREQLDLQISYKLLKKKLEIKLNAGNLLNRVSSFYQNQASYEPNPDYVLVVGDQSNAHRLKPGFTDKYEEGDITTFTQKFGRTYSTSLTYNF